MPANKKRLYLQVRGKFADGRLFDFTLQVKRPYRTTFGELKGLVAYQSGLSSPARVKVFKCNVTHSAEPDGPELEDLDITVAALNLGGRIYVEEGLYQLFKVAAWVRFCADCVPVAPAWMFDGPDRNQLRLLFSCQHATCGYFIACMDSVLLCLLWLVSVSVFVVLCCVCYVVCCTCAFRRVSTAARRVAAVNCFTS